MITQAEIVAFDRLDKESKVKAKELASMKAALVGRVDTGEVQEVAGQEVSLKLVVNHPPYNTPAYKEVVDAIKELNAVFTNGGGKPHLLNDRIPALVTKAIPTNEDGTPKTKTEIKVEVV